MNENELRRRFKQSIPENLSMSVTPFEIGMVVDDLQASLVKNNKELHIHGMTLKKKNLKIILPQVQI